MNMKKMIETATQLEELFNKDKDGFLKRKEELRLRDVHFSYSLCLLLEGNIRNLHEQIAKFFFDNREEEAQFMLTQLFRKDIPSGKEMVSSLKIMEAHLIADHKIEFSLMVAHACVDAGVPKHDRMYSFEVFDWLLQDGKTLMAKSVLKKIEYHASMQIKETEKSIEKQKIKIEK